jgi:hypothetical protein
MRRPQPAEECIAVVDNRGRECIRGVEYDAHFILEGEFEDETSQPAHADELTSLTRRVLQHALASV